MATHSSILAWRIPWMEELGGLTVHGVAKNRTRLSNFTFTLHFHVYIHTHIYTIFLHVNFIVKAMVFSSSHVQIWRLDYKESWAPKNWCFWTMVLEKTLESHLDCKEIKTVHPNGDRCWVFIGRTDAKAQTPILWPPDAKRKRPWCRETFNSKGEEGSRSWDV